MYVSPGDILTDVPSWVPSASVCMLSSRVWKEIENSCGPHSIYLIALDSKAPIVAQGCRLMYFSLCPTKGSAGVIVFSQNFHPLNNSLFFPNLALRAGLALRFLAPHPFPFTFVASDPHPLSLLVACYLGRAIDSVLLGTLADHIVLLFTTSDNAFLS